MSKIFNISLKEALKIAELNKTETSIVNALKQSKKSLTVGQLIDILHLERLVIFYNLKKLEKRGILKCDMTRRAHIWSLSSMGKPGILNKTVRYISISDAYQALHDSAQQKIIGIQGTNAIKSIIKGINEKNTFFKTHKRQKLRQVIIDCVLTKSSIEIIKNLSVDVLKSHFGRPSILHIIPDNHFITEHEILSDGKILAIIDHENEIAVINEDPLVNKGFLALHETIKLGAKKVNPTEVYGEISS